MAEQDAFQAFCEVYEKFSDGKDAADLKNALVTDGVSPKSDPEGSTRVLNLMGEGIHAMHEAGFGQLAAALKPLAILVRQGEWRLPIGQSKIFEAALQILQTARKDTELDAQEQCLRLLGNCCADNDEIRAIFISSTKTIEALLQDLDGPLSMLVISVLYNASLDYEPAQKQLASSGAIPILIQSKLLTEENQLACELLDTICLDASSLDDIDDPTCLKLLQVCSEATEPTSFAALANTVGSLLSTTNRDTFLKDSQNFEIYANVLQKAHDLVIKYQAEPDEDEYTSSVQSLYALIGKLYDITAADSFSDTLQSPFFKQLTAAIKSSAGSTVTAKQVAYLITLANMTRTNDTAIAVLQEGVPEATINEIKQASLSSDKILSPILMHAALQLLGQIAIPTTNKPALIKGGLLDVLMPILAQRSTFSEEIQMDTLTIVRRLIAGSAESILAFNNAPISSESTEQDSAETGLESVLGLFQFSDKAPVKLEIGRFVAEICRSLGISPRTTDNDRQARNDVLTSLSGMTNLAEPLAFIAINAQSPGAKTEGWFALGVMSSWPEVRPEVVRCLDQNEELVKALEQICSEQNKADLDNVRVILTNVAEERSSITPRLQTMLENAAQNAGLESLHFS